MSIFSSVEKKSRLINIVSFILTRVREETKIKHLFVIIHLILLKMTYRLRVIIDCEVIWNFFAQFKLIKIDVLISIESLSNSELKTLNYTSFVIYFDHALSIEIIDINELKRTLKETFVEVDMYEMNIILSLFWLFHANFLIRFRERIIVHEIIHLIASEVRNDSIEKRLKIVVIVENNFLRNCNFIIASMKM